jgi:hypothetical protein
VDGNYNDCLVQALDDGGGLFANPNRAGEKGPGGLTCYDDKNDKAMFELETLAAFGIGAGLMALAPVAAAVFGKESSLATSVGSTGRKLTKGSLKVGLFVVNKTSSAAKVVGSGLAEVGETFGDILAEAKTELGQAKGGK